LSYAASVAILKTLHVLGAILLLGGVTSHVLLRPMASRAAEAVRAGLNAYAWRVELLMVYIGSALALVTGIIMWIGHYSLLTGWLVLGVLLYVAAMGLDGTFLSRTIRPSRRRGKSDESAIAAAAHAESSATLAAAAMTVQLVVWALLVVVVILMVAKP
jgi:uncharacterized membrane protein